MVTVFNNLDYRIDEIIPDWVATRYKEVIENEGLVERDLRRFNDKCGFWSKDQNCDIGSRRGLGWKLETEGAFGKWVIVKHPHGAPYAWNEETLTRHFLNAFELFVIIREFGNAKFNQIGFSVAHDVTVKDNKKYVDGVYIEDIKPLGKIEYSVEEV